MFDVALLSRIQFAFTVSFHIIFPAFSIGLATFLAIMEGVWLKTKNPLYLEMCKFWIKIFALTFGMGVVSGIVMEFQLGTNWSGLTDKVGPVLGVLFSYEVLTAFFIEAGFLGVMIFGWNKVGPKLHYCSTLLVVLGVTLSAFWILSANSWMQYPTGATLVDGRFRVIDWWSVIVNDMVIPRFWHMLIAAYLSTITVIGSISAYYLLKKVHLDFAKKCFSFAINGLLVLMAFQLFLGDAVGLRVHQFQPIKTAAIEAVWETEAGAPLLLFAIPDMKKQENLYSISIPHFASVLNTHQWNGVLTGLKTVSREDIPHVPVVFFTFRIMVGCGLLLLFLGLIGLYLRYKKQLYDSRWFLWSMIFAAPLGFIAVITGWFTAEFGRQPWVVYQVIRTMDAATQVTPAHVITSFVLLILVYGVVFGVFYFKYLFKIIRKGPSLEDKIEQQPFGYLSEYQLAGDK
jgi:cytochrome bd ubiquinol oxidase subunit I